MITTESAHDTLWLGSSVVRKASSEKTITASRKNPTACEMNTLAIMPMMAKFSASMAFTSLASWLGSTSLESSLASGSSAIGVGLTQNPAPVSAEGACTRIRA